MSFAENETKPRVAVDNTSRGLPNDLQRFAKAGLDLKIGDFRLACAQITERIHDHKNEMDLSANDFADILFDWMMQTAPPPDAKA